MNLGLGAGEASGVINGIQSNFVTTAWSVVELTHDDSVGSRQAIETLFKTYWFPLYVYARRKGFSGPESEDLVQGFLSHVLERETLSRADRTKGRFRSFLIGAFNLFVAENQRHKAAAKRSPGTPCVSIDQPGAERRFQTELSCVDDPSASFDRAWARTILDRAFARLLDEYSRTGKAVLQFELLRGLLVGDASCSISNVAQRLGMTEGAVRVATHRLKCRLGELLREEVAASVDDQCDIDDELRELMRSLA